MTSTPASTQTEQTKSKLDSLLEKAYQLDLEGRTDLALQSMESALAEARRQTDPEAAKSRFVIAMMLPQFYLSQAMRDQAFEMLGIEVAYARERLQTMKSGGTTEEKQHASRVFVELRDYQTRIGLLGQPAPEIEVGKWLSGEPATLQSLTGQVVLLEFWATWCKPCEQMFPKLKQFDRDYRDQGLNVIALTRHYLAYGGSAEAKTDELNLMRKMVSDHELTFRVGVSEDERTQDHYGAAGVPTMALIDRSGIVRHFYDGDEEGFQTILGECLTQSA